MSYAELLQLLDPRDLIYTLLGAAILFLTLRPGLSRHRWLNVPLAYVLAGLALGAYGVPTILPGDGGLSTKIIEHVSELIVIVSLAGAGLAIDTRETWANWRPAYRLLLIAMPLTILGIFASGYWWLGLAWPSAMLLAAVLAPTDPVLARSVQVGPPGRKETPMQVSLTAEAGLNDGLAFPFVHLALAAAAAGYMGQGWPDFLTHWVWYDFLYRVGAGLLLGYVVGFAITRLVFGPLGDASHGGRNTVLVVVASTFLSYGLAEAANAYGFLSVFVAARAGRHVAREAKEGGYTAFVHHGAEQLESILLVILLIWFGMFVGSGGLTGLHWAELGFALLLLLVLRPLTGRLAMLGLECDRTDAWKIAFFGIRGMGTVFYIAYAQTHGQFSDIDTIWRVSALVILLSIVLHGFGANFVIEEKAEAAEDHPGAPSGR